MAKVQTQEGVTIRWVWAAPYERNDWRRAWNWLTFYLSVLREATIFERADVIIGSSPQIFAALAARSLAKRNGSRFVFEVRDLWPESLLAVGGSRGIAYHLIDRVARGLYRAADRILVLAHGTAEYLARRGIPRSKIVHVPNGVDVSAMRPSDGNTLVGKADAATFTVLYAGAHGPANGLDRVLDAAEILKSSANVRFRLVGDGPTKAQLREDAQRRDLSNIEFLDPVPKNELLHLLNDADAALMVLRDAPLFSFGVSPNKLFDYLAAGLPVVCNVPGEVAQMLADAGAGVQLADTSGAALAEGIREIVALSPAQRREKGAAGRRWVEQEHSREVLGQRMDAFLRELVAS